jgi:hypothetical protein
MVLSVRGRLPAGGPVGGAQALRSRPTKACKRAMDPVRRSTLSAAPGTRGWAFILRDLLSICAAVALCLAAAGDLGAVAERTDRGQGGTSGEGNLMSSVGGL